MLLRISRALRSRTPNFMPGLSYAVIIAVAAGEVIDISFGPALIPTIALLAAFLFFHLIARRTERTIGFAVAVLAEAACALGVLVVGPSPSYGIVLLFVVCPLVTWRLALWVPIIGTAVTLAGATVLLVVKGHGFQVWFPTLIGWSLAFSALIGFSVTYQRSRQKQAESEQLLAELTDAQDRIRDIAVLKERDRLAREMHDAVGHRLTVATVLLESAGRLIPTDPERAVQIVDTSRTQVREGLEELRAAVRALVTPDQRSQPVTQMLQAIVDVYSQATGARVSLEVQAGLAEPDPDRKMVIVRTAQEALTNTQKHSFATLVELALAVEEGSYVLTCSDNGRGIPVDAQFAAERGHFGLENLRSRASTMGGSIELRPSSEGGAILRLTLPVPDGNVRV